MSIQPLYQNRDHALVIGGGFAGLAAASILLRYFAQVTLIERDHYPQEPGFRPGVPQGRQTHVLLKRGSQTLEELFPGITQKLLADGAVSFDTFKDSITYHGEGRNQRFSSQMHLYSCSRTFLEWHVYQELRQYPRLQILEEREVVGFLTDSSKQTITGVKIRERSHEAPQEQDLQTIDANLVIDASGRSTHTPQWLQALGYQPPQETIINSFLGYASCVYEPDPTFQRDWKSVAIQSSRRQSTRGGLISSIEGGRWMVVLAGAGRDYPPTDEAGFLEFARSLPDPIFYQALKEAKLISKIYGYRRTENRWYHYERLSRLPENLMLIGDAVCAFNPVYGQGMTVALLEAKVLDTCLRNAEKTGLHGLAPRFQKILAHTVAIPWQLSTSSDSRLPTTEGAHINSFNKLLYAYMDRIVAMLPHDQNIAMLFSEVTQLIRPPVALFRPDVILKILLQKPRSAV